METVTFKQFRKAATRAGYSVDDLVDLFHGKLDENRPLFERVMGLKGVEFDDVVIPYRSVLKFYESVKDSLTPQFGSKTKNRGLKTALIVF